NLIHLRYPQGVFSTVHTNLRLRGPLTSPLLQGTVDVLRVSYRPRIAAETGLLGLAGGVGGGAAEGEAVGDSPAGIQMALDIRVRAPSMPIIENDQATIRGRGDMQISGTADVPIITGRIDIESGQFVFLGNRYAIQPGSIDFSNPLKLVPYFDVSAVT